jgi:hypothetical protein
MKLSGIELELFGRRLRLESGREDFLRYVSVALEPFLAESGAASPDIVSRLMWRDQAAPRGSDKAFGQVAWESRPDRDLLLAPGKAWWARIDDFPDLTLTASTSTGCLEIEGFYHFQIGREPYLEPLRRLRQRKNLNTLQGRRFSTLLYYLVYHPLLWDLSRRDGWHTVHGGAVARDGGALVFLGAPGCGKSTLAVSLLANPEVHMLSDNLILHDKGKVRACPELLLLDERSLAFAGAGASRMQPTGERRVFGRDAYRPDRVLMEPVAARALCWVQRGRESRLEETSAAKLVARSRGGSLLAKEVRRSVIMSEVLDLMSGAESPDAARDLAELAAGVPCWLLTVGEDGEGAALAASLLA